MVCENARAAVWLYARFWCVRSGVALGDGMHRRHVRDRRGVGACVSSCDVVCRRVWWGAKVAKGPERGGLPQLFCVVGTAIGVAYARDACTWWCVCVYCSAHECSSDEGSGVGKPMRASWRCFVSMRSAQ